MKKNLTRALMLTAVALTLGAAAAYAHTYLYARIPFSFRMNGSVLPAGEYSFSAMLGDGAAVILRDQEATHTAVSLTSVAIDDGSKSARLVFRCDEAGSCSLIEAWDGLGRGWRLPNPRPSAAEKVRLAVVALHTNAE